MPIGRKLRAMVARFRHRVRLAERSQRVRIIEIKTASRKLDRYNLTRCIIEMVSDRDDLSDADLSALILLLRSKVAQDPTAERNHWERMRN